MTKFRFSYQYVASCNGIRIGVAETLHAIQTAVMKDIGRRTSNAIRAQKFNYSDRLDDLYSKIHHHRQTDTFKTDYYLGDDLAYHIERVNRK